MKTNLVKTDAILHGLQDGNIVMKEVYYQLLDLTDIDDNIQQLIADLYVREMLLTRELEILRFGIEEEMEIMGEIGEVKKDNKHTCLKKAIAFFKKRTPP